MSPVYMAFIPLKKWLFAVLNVDFTPGPDRVLPRFRQQRIAGATAEAEATCLSLALTQLGLLKEFPDPSESDPRIDPYFAG
jgi:hypothetical protein